MSSNAYTPESGVRMNSFENKLLPPRGGRAYAAALEADYVEDLRRNEHLIHGGPEAGSYLIKTIFAV
jgi:hypothetical protein